MMRLIDAGALFDSFKQKEYFKTRTVAVISAKQVIESAPTIDAEPVRHGHWIIHVDELFPADSTQECSVCHGEEWLGIKHENYCPNCGAKMDEVSE